MKSLFEQMGGTYTEVNGYLIPDLTLPEQENISFGKYGILHKKCLKKHKCGVYRELLYSGKLNTYLVEIDAHAKEMLENLTREMAKKQGVTEKLKTSSQMKWVGMMNNIRHSAEEIVINEIVYN